VTVESNIDGGYYCRAEAVIPEAISDGFKIIHGVYGVPDKTFIDTLENRMRIVELLKKNKDYFATCDYLKGRVKGKAE
jgi:hypothetical protein